MLDGLLSVLVAQSSTHMEAFCPCLNFSQSLTLNLCLKPHPNLLRCNNANLNSHMSYIDGLVWRLGYDECVGVKLEASRS
eukprot:4035781-Amphidinium_carterae.1